MNYIKLVFQIHRNKSNTLKIYSNCLVIKLNDKKSLLNCLPKNPIKSALVDGNFNLGDAHLIILFKNDKYIIMMGENDLSNGLLNGAILVIIISIIIIIIGITLVIIFIKRKQNSKNKSSDYSTLQIKSSQVKS